MKKVHPKDRVSPTEHIANTPHPEWESAYVKVPGYAPRDVSFMRDTDSVCTMFGCNRGVNDYLKKTGQQKYTHIHTHPSPPNKANYEPRNRKHAEFKKAQTCPSLKDLKSFFDTKDNKAMVITQKDRNNGEISGHLVFRKSKKEPSELSKHYQEELAETKIDSNGEILKMPYYLDVVTEKHYNLSMEERNKDWANRLGLQYRFVPVSADHPVNIKLRQGKLEATVSATAAIVGLLGGIFFLSSNVTGNVIGLSQSSSNVLGAILIIIGLVGGFLWMRKKK